MRAVHSVVRSAQRAIARHRIDSEILLVFLVLAASLFVFIKLASEVIDGDTLTFDR